MKPASPGRPLKVHALAFGLFLGLCIWKFGDPVILDRVIGTPATLQDFWGDAWPIHWANCLLLPLVVWGTVLIFQQGASSANLLPQSKWLWLLPLAWLAWQFASATQTVAPALTAVTLWQFGGCVACYFLGVFLLAREQLVRWLLVGVLAAFAFCLVRGVDQRLFEYPQNYQSLAEGERTGWTNFPPATVAEMKSERLIVTTNGMDVANPTILAKFARGRVCGTLVYPNALAEIILLLWPVSLALAFGATRPLRPFVKLAAMAMTVFLGAAAFFWTGSKLGWLLAIGLAGVALLRLDGSKKLKFAAVAAVLILGLGVFAARFHHYFAAGATSAGARFDYWRAAAQITDTHPAFGTGPGTFSQPYSHIKSPESEMARLAHNDYLEQFCDSGIPGGLAYTAWIVLALAVLARKFWPGLTVRPEVLTAGKSKPTGSGRREGKADVDDPVQFALFLGLAGWFAQGLGEFGLYVPALAWTAFTLLGCLIGRIRPA
ncbi:MAG: O-antigen ligase family protein [Verrucomicrobiota bacterium]